MRIQVFVEDYISDKSQGDPTYFTCCESQFLSYLDILRLGTHTVQYTHRRRMETETKAKCRRFGMGGKIECRTGNFGVIV